MVTVNKRMRTAKFCTYLHIHEACDVQVRTLHAMGTIEAIIPDSNGMTFFYLEVAEGWMIQSKYLFLKYLASIQNCHHQPHKRAQHISFGCAPREFCFPLLKRRKFNKYSVINDIIFIYQTHYGNQNNFFFN